MRTAPNARKSSTAAEESGKADGARGCYKLLRGVARSEFQVANLVSCVAQARDCPRGYAGRSRGIYGEMFDSCCEILVGEPRTPSRVVANVQASPRHTQTLTALSRARTPQRASVEKGTTECSAVVRLCMLFCPTCETNLCLFFLTVRSRETRREVLVLKGGLERQKTCQSGAVGKTIPLP